MKEEFHELFMQASDGIFIADLEGRYTDVNPAGCQLLGCARQEIVGKTIVDFIDAGDVPRLHASRSHLLQGSLPPEEWAMRRGDGSFAPMEVSAKILSDGRWIAFVRDITERKRALQAAQAMAEELERRVAQRTEQMRRLVADLEAAENRERRQIARDLHDDLAQTLSAARIRLAGLLDDPSAEVRATVGAVGELIDRASRSTRSLAAQLAPAVLYELGLQPALESLAEEIERSFGLQVDIADDGQLKPLSQEARSILYRAVRELLINVAKHAGTRTAAVETQRSGDAIVLRIRDTGVGFDPVQVAARPQRGLGLVSVRERLSFIGGSAQVRSEPGAGTVAELSAPLDLQDRPPQEDTR